LWCRKNFLYLSYHLIPFWLIEWWKNQKACQFLPTKEAISTNPNNELVINLPTLFDPEATALLEKARPHLMAEVVYWVLGALDSPSSVLFHLGPDFIFCFPRDLNLFVVSISMGPTFNNIIFHKTLDVLILTSQITQYTHINYPLGKICNDKQCNSLFIL
jgi:hypothetical protein